MWKCWRKCAIVWNKQNNSETAAGRAFMHEHIFWIFVFLLFKIYSKWIRSLTMHWSSHWGAFLFILDTIFRMRISFAQRLTCHRWHAYCVLFMQSVVFLSPSSSPHRTTHYSAYRKLASAQRPLTLGEQFLLAKINHIFEKLERTQMRVDQENWIPSHFWRALEDSWK